MAEAKNLNRWAGVGPVALLLAAVAVFFWKVVTFQGALFFFDLIDMTAPIRSFFFTNVAHGRFPLWSQEICGGFPLFDEGQMGPFYLPNYLLFTWLPAWWALNVSVIFHATVGALGAYFYLKRSHSVAAAVIGAMTFVFAFPIVSHQHHYMFYEAVSLMPWLFFFADRFLEKGRIADVLGGALMLGAMFTTGHQQGGFFIAMAFGIFSLTLAIEAWAAGRRRAAVEIACAVALMAAIAVAESAVIVHSMARLLTQTARAAGMDASYLFNDSLVPDALAKLASPALLGRGMNGNWTPPHMNEREVAVYLGLAAWCFAALAFAGRSGRRDRAHLVVVAFGVLFALGHLGPLAGLVLHTPLLNRMRIPTRFYMPMSLSFSFLIASGLDRLRDANVAWRRAGAFACGGVVAWAGVAWASARSAYGAKLFVRDATAEKLSDFTTGVAVQLRHDLVLRSFLAAGLFAAAILLLRARQKKPIVQWALLAAIGALVFADLASAGRGENPVANPAIYWPQTTMDFLQPRLDGLRIYSYDSWGAASARGGWKNNPGQYGDSLESLPVDSPAFFGIRTASCESPLALTRQRRVLDTLAPEWFRQMSVKYGLSRFDTASGLPKIQTADRVKIFEVADPPPIYGLAHQVIPVASGEAAFASINKRDVDPAVAFVENAEKLALPALPAGDVETVEEQSDFRRLRVGSDRPAFLIVRENYYPGWRAEVDGSPVPIYRANYLFYGFPVPAGEHDVTLKYRPAGFRPTLAISLLTYLAVLGLAVFYRPFRRVRPALLDAPANERTGKIVRYVILALFVVLVIAAVAEHPRLWDFSRIRDPRWR